MRVLVDESLPRHRAAELPDHIVSTVRAQNWSRLRNGVLLRAAVDAGFEVLLTADQSIRYQQNLQKIGIAVVIVSRVRNRIADLRPLIRKFLLPSPVFRLAKCAKSVPEANGGGTPPVQPAGRRRA